MRELSNVKITLFAHFIVRKMEWVRNGRVAMYSELHGEFRELKMGIENGN